MTLHRLTTRHHHNTNPHPSPKATNPQLDALNILLNSQQGADNPDNPRYAVTLTHTGDLLVKVENREYLIDPDGTVTDMHYNDAQQTI